MANYTFTASSCYALKTHDVSFTATNLIIKLTSTGQTVFDKKYDIGISVMCDKDDFCVGTLSDNDVFKKSIDFNKPKAYIKIKEASSANTIIGSTNETDDGIYKYNINQCPIRLSQKNKIVTIECPCESDNGPCDHKCFSSTKS